MKVEIEKHDYDRYPRCPNCEAIDRDFHPHRLMECDNCENDFSITLGCINKPFVPYVMMDKHLADELDPEIKDAVLLLHDKGVETFESCQGGEGHAFLEPTIRFHGNIGAGFKAFEVASSHGLDVRELRMYWTIIDGLPTGPHWEMTFHKRTVK